MGTYMIDGECVDFITYVKAVGEAQREHGTKTPTQEQINEACLKRLHRLKKLALTQQNK